MQAVMTEMRATLFICFSIFFTIACGLNTRNDTTKNGVTAKPDIFYGTPGKYLPNAVLESREEPEGISRIECAAECQANPECKSFNLRSGNTRCELNSAVDFTPTKMALSDDSASRYYTKVPHDCGDYIGLDGVHCINGNSMNRQLRVSCEEGWTVLMRRTGPELNFNRSWVGYRDGFGDVTGDHWLGLEAFHHLTNQGNYSLLVAVRSLSTGNYYWEIHHGFRIGPESGKYVLHKFSRGSGNLTERNFWAHSFDMPFSTYDRAYGKHCSGNFGGGWWYNSCAFVSLTGKMAVPGECKEPCWTWFKHNGLPGSNNYNETALLRWAVMKIKKVD